MAPSADNGEAGLIEALELASALFTLVLVSLMLALSICSISYIVFVPLTFFTRAVSILKPVRGARDGGFNS